jgi:ribosomal-protein-alanine N-acetyltransferase
MKEISFLPFPALSTRRLILRQLTLNDDQEIFELRSDERVLQHLIISKCKNLNEAKQFIEMINGGINRDEWIYWGITENGNDTLIGTFCIWHISKENSRAEVGYALHPDHQGKGIMNEAMDVALDYGFNVMQLHSIEANVDPGNIASIKLLEKKGFVKEAHFKENLFYNGKFLDTAIYSLINPAEKV